MQITTVRIGFIFSQYITTITDVTANGTEITVSATNSSAPKSVTEATATYKATLDFAR
jgi:hypothetical protein